MKTWNTNSGDWVPKYGVKRRERILYRPLIPLLLAFTAGILSAHQINSNPNAWKIALAAGIATFLMAAIFCSYRLRLILLFIIFFLTGALLDRTQHQNSELLLPASLCQKKIILEGTILEPAKINANTARFSCQVCTLFEGNQPRHVRHINEKIMVTVYDHIPVLNIGEKIRFPCKIKPFNNFNNPGGYDYKAAMGIKGLFCAAAVSDGRYIVNMGSGHLPFYRRLLEKYQCQVRDFFQRNLKAENSAIYRAMILGERQGIDDSLREPFNRTGLGHVLAVSGLHMGLLAWTAFLVIKWLLSRSNFLPLRTDIKKWTAAITCLPILGYLFISGFQISSQRAAIMVMVFLFSIMLDREKELWSTLCLAGLIILAIDPHALFRMSFQLSFTAVTGILWLMPGFLKKLAAPDFIRERSWIYYPYNHIVGLMVVCFSVTLFLLPLTLYFFHRVSLVSLPANIMTVPILGLWVIPMGLLCAVIVPLSTTVAHFFLDLGSWGLDLMMFITRLWSNMPNSSFWMFTPNIIEMVLFYALIFFLYFRKKYKWAQTCTLVITVALLIDTGYWINRVRFNNDLRVSFIDVGQANAALLEFPRGKKMMIDGGGFPRDRFDVGRMVVAPFLWQSKILKVDYLVLSHPQSDHMNGLRFLAETFAPDEFWYNGDQVKTNSFVELMEIIDTHEIRKRSLADLLEPKMINHVKVEVLHPTSKMPSGHLLQNGRILNNRSLVIKISYHGKSFLFPGDLERDGEADLTKNAADALKSHVLLAPHHGSGNSGTPSFLEKVKPTICVISCGKNNFFGFPHEDFLNRLRKMNCEIVRIDQTGAAQFVVKEDTFEWQTFLPVK